VLDLWLAIAHHLIVFGLLGMLAVELALIRVGVTSPTIAGVAQLDRWYGLFAGGAVVVGFSRAVFTAKGWDYYEHNLFFWAKIATFALVGLFSVPPTLAYLLWRKTGVPDAAAVASVRRWLWAELALFALLPIFAALMARGYGMIGR
jgi:putative membrane protein